MANSAYVVDNGLAIVTNRLIGNGTEPKYIGWGTGTTDATQTDTGLQTASAEARTSGTSSQQTTNTTNDTYQVTGSILSLSTQTISELALFDALTDGNCYLHAVFNGADAIALDAGDSVAFTIKSVYNQV